MILILQYIVLLIIILVAFLFVRWHQKEVSKYNKSKSEADKPVVEEDLANIDKENVSDLLNEIKMKNNPNKANNKKTRTKMKNKIRKAEELADSNDIEGLKALLE